jgi:hypothetical protein
MNQESPSPARRMFRGLLADAGSAVKSFYLLDDRQIVRTVDHPLCAQQPWPKKRGRMLYSVQ